MIDEFINGVALLINSSSHRDQTLLRQDQQKPTRSIPTRNKPNLLYVHIVGIIFSYISRVHGR